MHKYNVGPILTYLKLGILMITLKLLTIYLSNYL